MSITVTLCGRSIVVRYFDQQDSNSKLDSYLDDDGESEHGAAGSDISQESSAHSSKLTADGMVITKV